MKLGEVLKKERTRKGLTAEELSVRLNIPVLQYLEMESGNSVAEGWGPKLASLAIKLQTPTSRLIAETGKSASAGQVPGQCGRLIKSHRERRGLSREEIAKELNVPLSEMETIEDGESPLETCAPLLLAFAEQIDQPIFNLFYPCGLPFSELTDYP